MLKAVRTRQRILATFLPIRSRALHRLRGARSQRHRSISDGRGPRLKLLAIAARHPTQLYVAATLSLLALGAVAVSYAAIALLITGRGWVIATVAALLGGIGAFCGAIAARFLMTAFNSGAGQLFTYVYFVSEFTAPVVMGFALWRSRRVPLWLAAMVLLSARIWLAADAADQARSLSSLTQRSAAWPPPSDRHQPIRQRRESR